MGAGADLSDSGESATINKTKVRKAQHTRPIRGLILQGRTSGLRVDALARDRERFEHTNLSIRSAVRRLTKHAIILGSSSLSRCAHCTTTRCPVAELHFGKYGFRKVRSLENNRRETIC
jgi:hypothetical protein